jgi:hypothetical protein
MLAPGSPEAWPKGQEAEEMKKTEKHAKEIIQQAIDKLRVAQSYAYHIPLERVVEQLQEIMDDPA